MESQNLFHAPQKNFGNSENFLSNRLHSCCNFMGLGGISQENSCYRWIFRAIFGAFQHFVSLGCWTVSIHHEEEIPPTSIWLKWKDYDRASYELPLDPAPAPYTLYTGFDLQHSVALFLVFMAFNIAAMALVKHFTSVEFSRDGNLYNKIVHVLQCTNISFPYVDWDQGGGSVEEFKLRYSNTEREMAWSFVVNSFFSLASIVPIIYTGRCMPKTFRM